jgi:hypothetical protein
MIRSLVVMLFMEKDCTKLVSDFPVIERRRPLFCGDQDVGPLREPGLVEPEKFPHEAFDSVSLYGVSGSLACRDPQSVRVRPAPIQSDEKMLRMKPPAGAI